MGRSPVRVLSMLFRLLITVLLLSSLGGSQAIDTSKVATVHVYRHGRLLIAVSVLADGNKVVALTPHKSATFYLVPGYHELTLQAGEISPTASFKAVGGGEYYFQMDYEHVVSAISLRDLQVSLSMQPRMTGAEDLREVSIDQSNLLEILAQSNPDGLEPQDPILTDANSGSAQRVSSKVAGQ
jgi:hypothetical protein